MSCNIEDLALIKSDNYIKCYSEQEVLSILTLNNCTLLKDPITSDKEYDQLVEYLKNIQDKKKIMYFYMRYTNIAELKQFSATAISMKNFKEKTRHLNDPNTSLYSSDLAISLEILEFYIFKCFQVLTSLNKRKYLIKGYLDLTKKLIEELYKIIGRDVSDFVNKSNVNKRIKTRDVKVEFNSEFQLGKLVFNLDKEEIERILNKFLFREQLCYKDVEFDLRSFKGNEFISHSRTIENKVGQCGLNSFITVFSVFNIFNIEFVPVPKDSSLFKTIPPGYIEFYNLFIDSLKNFSTRGTETICVNFEIFIKEMNKIPGYETRKVGGGLVMNDIVNIFMRSCKLLHEKNHKIPGFVFYMNNNEVFRTLKSGIKESIILRVSDSFEESFKGKNIVAMSLSDFEKSHAIALLRDFYFSPSGEGFALNTYTLFNNEYIEYFAKFPENMKNQQQFGIYMSSNFFN